MQAQEESTLTKIRTVLNNNKVKLWEAPYFDTEKNVPNEASLHELSVTITSDVNLPRPHIFQGLKMLQQNALEKLAARDRFKESGIANLKIRCAKGLKCRSKTCDIALSSPGAELIEQISTMVNSPKEKIKLICSGRVISQDKSLAFQNVKNGATIMVVLVGDHEALAIVAEQRKMMEETKSDAARLSGRDKNRDDYFLQVADQSGKSLDLPAEEKKSLIIAMSLHEKGRAALKKKQYPAAIVLLLEAEQEFSQCRSELLSMVDNFAILSLDIAWCYLALQTVSELPDAEARLARCEEKFKSSYGNNMERVTALKGGTGGEQALMARLHLLQGIVAFHLGRDREAKLLLEKVSIEMQLLVVDEMDLMEIASMGYSIAEARVGLRASLGDRKLAVDHIIKRREEKEQILKKEKEERDRGKLRDRLGRCADGSWINVGYYNTLRNMGFTEKVAAAALRQANNSLNTAVQLLQEEPDLISLAADEREGEVGGEPSDEMVASVVAMGFEADMAKVALTNEGCVERAVEKLMEGGGVVEPVEKMDGRAGKRRRTDEDEEAYNRIKEGITENEEDHLDLDMVEEGQLLQQYIRLLK
eukprot:GFUD01007917.1.p1 GENE.GFUD01007917.1~~GFUD01007917.1.p1  ORF type:complete len:590 (+),score=221.00 GFUD01007917.1:891-2660(+)